MLKIFNPEEKQEEPTIKTYSNWLFRLAVFHRQFQCRNNKVGGLNGETGEDYWDAITLAMDELEKKVGFSATLEEGIGHGFNCFSKKESKEIQITFFRQKKSLCILIGKETK